MVGERGWVGEGTGPELTHSWGQSGGPGRRREEDGGWSGEWRPGMTLTTSPTETGHNWDLEPGHIHIHNNRDKPTRTANINKAARQKGQAIQLHPRPLLFSMEERREVLSCVGQWTTALSQNLNIRHIKALGINTPIAAKLMCRCLSALWNLEETKVVDWTLSPNLYKFLCSM